MDLVLILIKYFLNRPFYIRQSFIVGTDIILIALSILLGFSVGLFTSIKSLTNGRKRHKKYFTDKEGSFQKDKERFKSDLPKDITWPTIKFEPQREDEIISWNKKKVLVDVK